MAVFTSWSDLYQAMLDQAAEFVAGRMSVAEYTLETGGQQKTIKYRTWKEFQTGLQYVKNLADLESGAAVGRTYAAQGGTGRW
jgi:hypothetical protein